jgi:hypothetical protein
MRLRPPARSARGDACFSVVCKIFSQARVNSACAHARDRCPAADRYRGFRAIRRRVRIRARISRRGYVSSSRMRFNKSSSRLPGLARRSPSPLGTWRYRGVSARESEVGNYSEQNTAAREIQQPDRSFGEIKLDWQTSDSPINFKFRFSRSRGESGKRKLRGSREDDRLQRPMEISIRRFGPTLVAPLRREA